MSSLKKQSCWEIMQCDDNGSCPVRQNGHICWEWMAENNTYQCHYGLCEDCIVYLYNNGNPILSSKEVEEVIRMRSGEKLSIAV